jgi:O-antigen/teichoic acid export membrane protein
MSLIKKLAGETVLYGLSSIIGRFLNVMLVPLYTNIFDKAEYGIVTNFFANMAFLMVIYSYRMESAFFRYGTPKEDRNNAYTTGIYSLISSTLLLLLTVVVFAQPIAQFMRYPDHADFVRYFGLILAFDCLCELPFARLRLEQKPLRFAGAKLFNIGINLTFNLFWLLFCPWAAKHGINWVYSVWNPSFGIGYIFLSNTIASGATLAILSPQLRDALKGTFQPELWKQMMIYAGPLVIVNMAGIVNETLDRAILSYLLPGTPNENLAQVGIYGANYKLAMLITLFSQAYRYAAEPFFFRNAGHADALKIQADATKWFLITAATGMLGILLFLDRIKYFIGPKFWVGLPVVSILLLANVLLGLYYNFSVWYRLNDKTRVGAWISIGGAAITIVLNLVFAPMFSYTASAWATLACYAFMSWAAWFTGRKEYPVPYALGRMAFYIGVVLALYGINTLVTAMIPGQTFLQWTLHIGLFACFPLLVYRMEDLSVFRKQVQG